MRIDHSMKMETVGFYWVGDQEMPTPIVIGYYQHAPGHCCDKLAYKNELLKNCIPT